MPSATKVALERELEFRKSAEDFSHFFLTHWKAVIPGAVSLVEHRPAQIESARVFQAERRVVVLKARQIGWSTLVAAYCFWKAWFHESMPVLVLSMREDPEAREIIAKIRIGYDGLPMWMKRKGAPILNRNLTKITFANGSYVDSDASKSNPARGRTVGLLVMDEFGKFPNPEEAWGSALPATEFGQMLVIGNPNGYGTLFWRLYTQAKQGLNDFRPLFYPWNVVPYRDQEWYDRETSSMTPAQKAAEFADDDEACWNKAGSPVYDTEAIKRWPTQIGVRGTLIPTGFRSAADGDYEIWDHPKPGFTYVIGADTAEGLEHGDFDAADVICADDGSHVARLYARLGPHEFAFQLDSLGRYYNKALLGVERNRNGGAVIEQLREHHKYPKLYMERTLLSTNTRFSSKYGWSTTRESKGILVNELWQALSSGRVTSTDPELFTQMAVFRYLSDGKMGGSPHDDRVMSFGICVQMLKAANPRAMIAPADAHEDIDWSKPQFAFGTTFGDWERWDQQNGSSRSSNPVSVMTPRPVTIAAVGSGRANWERSVSEHPSSASNVARPRPVLVGSRRIPTRGRAQNRNRTKDEW